MSSGWWAVFAMRKKFPDLIKVIKSGNEILGQREGCFPYLKKGTTSTNYTYYIWYKCTSKMPILHSIYNDFGISA